MKTLAQRLVLFTCMLVPLPLQAQMERYALVIGITGYPGFRTENRLQFADDDAVRFRDFILTPEGGGFRADNVLLVTNAAATRDSIARLVQWLQTRVQATDQLYVFFSGHTQSEQERVYFMPYDARQDNPAGRGWASDQFFEMFRSVRPRFLVMFADACQAASLFDSAAKGQGNDPGGQLLQTLNAALERESNQEVVLLSSSGTQTSFEDPNLRGGLFTHYLLKGLRGEADISGVGDRDGIVDLREITRFLQDSVEAHSLNVFHQLQTPTRTPASAPGFPLTAVRPTASPTVRERADIILEQAVSARDEFNLGRASFDRRDYSTAQRHYETALRIDPNYTLARNNLGFLFAQLGRMQEALAAYREAAGRDPNDFNAHFGWGAVALQLGDTTQAIQAFTAAKEIDPNDVRVLYNLATVLRFRDPQAALLTAGAAVQLAPDSARLRIMLGAILSDNRVNELAIDQYRQAIRGRDSMTLMAYQHLHSSYWRVADLPAAIQAMQAALSLYPNDTLALGNLRRAQARLRVFEDSAAQLRSRLNQSPHDANLKATLLRLYTNRLFQFDSSLALARRWHQSHPGDMRAGIEVAEALIASGRSAEARTVLQSALVHNRSVEQRIVLEALLLADDWFRGDTVRTSLRIRTLRALLPQRSDGDTPLPWSFYGLRHYVRGSQIPDREKLLVILEALQERNSAEIERMFVAMFGLRSPSL